jgi:hypothetical protein
MKNRYLSPGIQFYMKNVLLLLCFCCLTQTNFAQIGFSGSYVKISAPDWETQFNRSNRYAFGPDFQFKPSYQLGIDYWLRLKNYRVEFYPTLAFAKFRQEQTLLQGSKPDLNSQFNLSFWSLNFHTNIYPFDFEGDCHCPTWSKQNPIFKKGFFFQVSPGVTFGRFSITEPEGVPYKFDSNGTAFNLGIGVGLDIGISDLITLTPFVRVKRSFNVPWDGLYNRLNTTPSSDVAVNKSNVDQWEAGVRLGIRWTKY